MNKLIVFSIVAVTLLSFGSRGVHAQDITRPSGKRIAEGEWTFVAVVSRSGDQFQIPGVLALRDKNAAMGDNIVAVWFERPEDPESEWPSKAWPGQDHWECIKYLKEQYGIGDEWDFLWPTADQLTTQTEAKVPWDYERGLFTSDPLAGLVNMPNRDDIVKYLTELGYKSADLLIERIASGVQCGARGVLNAYADAVVFGAKHESADDADWLAEDFAPVLLGCLAQTTPPPPPPAVLPGTTTPVPGPPLSPGWQRDSRLPTPDPACSTTVSCCYSQPIIFLYSGRCVVFTCIRYCETTISWSCPMPANGVCPAANSCDATPPFMPAPGAVPVCGFSYY